MPLFSDVTASERLQTFAHVTAHVTASEQLQTITAVTVRPVQMHARLSYNCLKTWVMLSVLWRAIEQNMIVGECTRLCLLVCLYADSGCGLLFV